MPDVIISYKDSKIASMDASGTKTLLTEGKYCEDDIVVSYNKTGNATAEGDSSVSVNDAESGNICSLIQYGVCEQDAQTNAISCNNGTLSVSSGEIVTTAANREAIALGSQTATVENLYSVGNVRDEQELVTGTVTRKNAVCIYDGTQPVGDRYISSTGAKDNGAIIIYPLETEHTGDSVVSFTETVKQDVNSLEARIKPIQDLHGYANPWPAGGGVNKFGGSVNRLFPLSLQSGTVIIISADLGGASYGVARTYDSSETFLQSVLIQTPFGSRNYGVLTLASDISYIKVEGKTLTDIQVEIVPNISTLPSPYSPYSNICPISGRTGVSVYRRSANLLNSATNITGKYITTSGGINNGDDAQYTDLIPVKAGETYVCSLVSGRNSGNNRWHAYDANGTWVKQLASVSATDKQGVELAMAATIDSGISYVRLSYDITDAEAMICLVDSDSQISADGYYIGIQTNSTATASKNFPIQSPWTSENQWRGPAIVFSVSPGKIYAVKANAVTNYSYISYACYSNIEDINDNTKAVSRGQGASFVAPNGANYAVVAYINNASGTTFTFDEPYAGEISAYQPYIYDEYPCDWSSQAGTVYEGSDNPVTGDLVSRYGMVDLGTLTWTYNGIRFLTYVPDIIARQDRRKGICSTYPVFNGSVSAAPDKSLIFSNSLSSDYSSIVYIKDSAYSDADDFKAAMSGVQLCYELATPLTYQLTPQEVVTLVGVNNIFSPDATSIKVAVSNPVIEYIASQPLTLAEGSNTVSATNLSVSSVPLELNYISKVVQPTPTINLQSKTASPTTSSQTITADSGYDGLSSVTVDAMPSGSINLERTRGKNESVVHTLDSDNGQLIESVRYTIEAHADVTPGYIQYSRQSDTPCRFANYYTFDNQVPATVYTPTTYDQQIMTKGCFITGTQTVKGDSNLRPYNIKNGVTIFGVTGTHVGDIHIFHYENDIKYRGFSQHSNLTFIADWDEGRAWVSGRVEWEGGAEVGEIDFTGIDGYDYLIDQYTDTFWLINALDPTEIVTQGTYSNGVFSVDASYISDPSLTTQYYLVQIYP